MKRSNKNPLIDYSAETLIKQMARAMGFSRVGITGVEPSRQSDDIFDRWIGAKRQGEMRYLAAGNDTRHDPSLLLGEARSVICVAVNYYSKEKDERNRHDAASGNGVVSMYARTAPTGVVTS